MLRIFRYLKPYTLSIIAVLGLLFVQAMGELALPNYMSDIVNVGIQQGGIESAVPEAIRATQLEKMVLFMSEEEKTAVQDAYVLLDPELENYAALTNKYPNAEPGAVFVRKPLSEEQINALNPVVGKALLVVYTLEQAASDPAKAAQLGELTGFDLSLLPAGTDIFTLLKQLPPQQLQTMLSGMETQFAGLDNSMITQAAAAAVRAENDALGVNAQRLQTNYILRIGGSMLLVLLGSGCQCDHHQPALFAHRRRLRPRPATRPLRQSGEFFQSGVRNLLHRFTHHPLNQRCYANANGGNHDDAHALLRADHGSGRDHPRI